MKKSKGSITGAMCAHVGSPQRNRYLMQVQPDVERTHKTRDPGIQGQDGYGSIYDLARSMTSGKWGNSPKTGK